MVKNKKGYNWKSRQVSNIEVEAGAKIPVDFEHRQDEFDNSNPLVLPSQKRKTKNKDKQNNVTRLLSKKHRKQLEKVVEKKKKKQNRAALVEQLSQVQVSEEELKQYVPLTVVQTKGLKRHRQEMEFDTLVKSQIPNVEDSTVSVNSLKVGKKLRLALLHEEKKKASINDPNVLGFEESSESEDENDSMVEDENDSKTEDEDKDKNEDTNDSKNEGDNNPVNEKIKDSDEITIIEPVTDPEVSKEEKSQTESTSNVDETSTKKVKTECKPAMFVSLDRKPEVQESRLKLPILAEEQVIVEAINENPVVIITGETGSGKTTQVPQFLYEAGYGKDKMIGITEPRRVAAVSMSKRVAEEMNLSNEEVSYLIRFEGNATANTKVKFMTDGVLLKEVQNDFLLKKYSVIILDEAHERSVYTDILIGLLTRIVSLRAKRGDPLKLIIMSATLRVNDFINNPTLFKVKPPVINVESRQFPVTIHFNRTTSQDYVKDALRKTVKIHNQLPDGGILIFLTGQREVNTVVRRLRKAFPFRKKRTKSLDSSKNSALNKTEEKEDEEDENSEDEFYSKSLKGRKKKTIQKIKLPRVNLDAYSAVPPDDGQDDLIDLDDMQNGSEDDLDEDEDDEDIDLNTITNSQPLWVLPLYSLLPSHKQAKVFQAPPDGCRLCVVATNVAETSLTIPNVKYVVDSGRCKTRLYDKMTGVTTFRVTFTSKAGANQRAGRAGRTGPGHCYRLYSSAVFNDQFEDFAEPEIRRKPVDDLLLQMKVMNIDKVVNFPFPTPPGEDQLKIAEKRLTILGALQAPSIEQKQSDKYCAKVTDLGRSIASFPVMPRYGKMLALSQQHNLVNYTVCMVAALSVQELLVESFGDDGKTKSKWLQTRRYWAGSGNSLLLGDPMVLIRAVGAAEYSSLNGQLSKFCEEHGLREKAMIEIRKLRHQLTNEIILGAPDLDLKIQPDMKPPTDTEAKLLRQIILAGMVDQVARKLTPDEIKEGDDIKNQGKYAYKTMEMEEPVFMHSSCVLRKNSPEFVVYQEVYETNKTYMRGVTVIEPEWLPKFAPSLCNLSEPLNDPPPRYDAETGKVMCHRTGTFGPSAWDLPMMELEYPESLAGIKWFVRFFLEGEVCPKLKCFVPCLLTNPNSVNKIWAKLIPRIEVITKELLCKGIMTKEKLEEEWKSDSKFLLKAYQKWLPDSRVAEASMMWPPL